MYYIVQALTVCGALVLACREYGGRKQANADRWHVIGFFRIAEVSARGKYCVKRVGVRVHPVNFYGA
jgi:hypothetical protein